ncbi:MAG TPA: hypothetical protein VFO58_04170 [Vicinamibacterales bacterium]|nr:hypothetical protein [Vicinamibacterales bacterium]
MKTSRIITASAVLVVALLAGVRTADVSGTWSATFDTQMGQQQYTYTFVVKGTELTGIAKGNLTGETKISDGKVDGQKITFVENATFMEMPVRFEYSGTMTSADEIKMSRKVLDIATEELVAKRVK